MIKFIKLDMSVDPFYILLLKEEMKLFKWLEEFITYDTEGKITLFDIQDGLLLDAVQQATYCFFDSKEALDSLSVNIEAIDGIDRVKIIFENNSLVEYYMKENVWIKNQ